MEEIYIDIGKKPDFVMSMGQIIYRHNVSISVTQNHQTREVPFSDHSQIQVIRNLQSLLKTLQNDGPINWAVDESVIGRMDGLRIGFAIRYKLPSPLQPVDRIFIYQQFIDLINSFWNSPKSTTH